MPESAIAAQLAELAAEQCNTRELVERLVHAIEGNGTPGLKTRVDRLEQTEESRRRWAGIVGATAFSGLALAAWAGIKQLLK